MTRPDSPWSISVEGLTRSFGEAPVVDGLTFDLPHGVVLALLGHNGAGKTTTIRLLNGVLTPDSGRSLVLGHDPVVDGTALRRRTGVLTENAGLDDRLTARENLRFTAAMRGQRGPSVEARIEELLERFGMARDANRPCRGFSTGQRRRVAIARSLLGEPELLFLDEPTSGLDPAAAHAVMDLIATMTREQGCTVVLCTHFLAEAGDLADWMAVMHQGRMHAYGRPEELSAGLWPGLDVDFQLGGSVTRELIDDLRHLSEVMGVSAVTGGLRVTVVDRNCVPAVVRRAVASGAEIYSTTPRPKTLEDVYFAYEAVVPQVGRPIAERDVWTPERVGV